MGRVVYLFNVSLDGFVNTAEGSLDWTVIDDELHGWFNEQTSQWDKAEPSLPAFLTRGPADRHEHASA